MQAREEMHAARAQAVTVLQAMLKDRTNGSLLLLQLNRLLPEGLLDRIRDSGDHGSTAVLDVDASHDNPELVWDSEMHSRTAAQLQRLATQVCCFQVFWFSRHIG